MIPYQEAGQRIKEQGERPARVLGSVASMGLQAAGISGAASAGASLMKRALPFLSKYIPQELAIKGLNKLDPRFGKFIKNAMDEGHDFEEVKNFIEEKGTSELEEQEKSKEHRNIIEQYSPELFQSLKDQIQRGRTPLEAASHALHDPNFSKIIKKIQTDHKTSFATILKNIFREEEAGLAQQGRQQAQPQQSQSGQGQQALLAILQKIQQSRGQ